MAGCHFQSQAISEVSVNTLTYWHKSGLFAYVFDFSVDWREIRMRDWILVSIVVEWSKSIVTITFNSYDLGVIETTAIKLVNLITPKRDDWSESESADEYERLVNLD